MMFRDQVGILTDWFRSWNECEQTVALLSLLKRISRTQARFLHICLEHWLADCSDTHILEAEANNAAIVSQWYEEPSENLAPLLLSHLPLLQPGNTEAKAQYMKLLRKVLSLSMEGGGCVEESRQLLSYALIHPATSPEDRHSLSLWLNHLEESQQQMQQLQGSEEWCIPGDTTGVMMEQSHWHEKMVVSQNGHTGIGGRTTGDSSPANTCTGLPAQTSSIKPSMSLTPVNQPVCTSDWLSQDEGVTCPGVVIGADHAPLSPQSSVASSGSEQTEDQSGARNSFQEDGSGMRDVPAWLKSLRLHKYASLFSQMSYEEMMILTEQHLESQNVTKGARHKIALSIQKLRERQSVMKSLEKDILEGGNLRNALQELQQIIITPIKVFVPPAPAQKDAEPVEKSSNHNQEKEGEAFPTHNPPVCDGESTQTPIADGDIAGQFTRVMGKVCTQLLVSRPDEENINCYLQLIEKCLTHEAFTETQKKRLLSWKQQVLKLLRLFPRKPALESGVYRRGWPGFGSNSLPTAGSVCAGLARRAQRPFPITHPHTHTPPRGAAAAPPRILMSAGASPRHTHTPVSAQGRQGLWFGNPGGSNSMPSQSRSSVQRTHSLPVHTTPQSMVLYQQQHECLAPGTDLEINPTLESLCLSMTEHALGDGVDRTSTI
ncbi:hypothetical protein DNTS_022702 [Danionella cerebrum]|uniref:SAM domain-containing protein n=1 Tax=Danionella cerebrum TaxID=2873325 RepID=A0A553MXY6_9TELE|nr:hypothetical protein DNTS_022702 [Danionella translucida]TRY58050.1 hypothetical protein DNTS_022702 [Danionella translucida]